MSTQKQDSNKHPTKILGSQTAQAIKSFYDHSGVFVLATEDQVFIKCLCDILQGSGVSRDNFYLLEDFSLYAKKIDKILKQGSLKIVLFAEASLRHRHCYFEFQNIKYLYGDSCLLVSLSTNPTKEISSLYYEMGADSIIVKPASLDEITKKILTLFEDNNDAQTVAKCREKIKLGDIQEASQLAQTLTATHKAKSRGFTLMGEVFREKGDHTQARKCYRKAHSLSQEYLEPLHGLVEIARNEDEKLDYLEKLDKISPMNSSRKIEIGKMYASRGKVNKAEKYFKSAVTALNHIHTATKANAVSDIAEFYKEIDINKSIQYMKAAIRLKKDRLGPGDFGMFNEIGLSLRKQGRWEEAIDYYRMALNIAENPGIYFNIGMAYMQGKQYLKSIDHMTKAVHMDSDLLDSSPFIPSNLGIAYAKTKNFDKALLYLEKALEIDPEHGPSLDYLARMKKT